MRGLLAICSICVVVILLLILADKRAFDRAHENLIYGNEVSTSFAKLKESYSLADSSARQVLCPVIISIYEQSQDRLTWRQRDFYRRLEQTC